VSARDKATSKEQKIVIQSSGGLSKDQIENMIRESEKFAEKDKKRRELIEEINKAESILHDTESKMEEFKSQLPNGEYDNLKNQITNLRDKLAKIDRENDTVDEIKPQVDEFQRNSLKLFEMAYKKVRLFILVKIF
jgi:molecular chaperone DnaK